MEGDRADPLEGVAINRVPGTVKLAHSDGHERALAGLRMRMTNCFDITIQNCETVVRLPPMRIFCAALEPDEAYRAKHDLALFHIPDFAAFVEAISGDNAEMGKALVRAVKYEPRVTNPFEGPAARPDPFSKNPKFAWEKEVRAIWPQSPSRHPATKATSVARHVIRLV